MERVIVNAPDRGAIHGEFVRAAGHALIEDN
jgi:hypothetical protein